MTPWLPHSHRSSRSLTPATRLCNLSQLLSQPQTESDAPFAEFGGQFAKEGGARLSHGRRVLRLERSAAWTIERPPLARLSRVEGTPVGGTSGEGAVRDGNRRQGSGSRQTVCNVRDKRKGVRGRSGRKGRRPGTSPSRRTGQIERRSRWKTCQDWSRTSSDSSTCETRESTSWRPEG